ncbi:transketolase [Helicobacter japonicus]|uniref:Transketolase n=3 Tax=Helicobacter japonicus TaxID=425400 RepID=A0A4U8TPF1_9HELI|nr:transketolase [Helicobacter japonicus]TLE01956.1 transketolase [Helicobacter japonicus]
MQQVSPHITKEDIPLLQKMSHTLGFLCADMVQKANSGHPGAPMGLADIASVLSFHLHLAPHNPTWLNRDRLVFSGGHASALVYALLHLWGFDVSKADLQSFRKIHSKTPGHPEYGHTQGVEITTGPLGQGIANAVGMAMASKYAQNLFGKEIISHYVYCLCGDGDLQEGISYEAASLAGHHQLSNLIVIYDSNTITIEGNTNISMSEDIAKRFESQGFEVFSCDGHSFLEIDNAISCAKSSPKPSIIIAKTKIAKNALSLEGSHKAHGAPLGEEIIFQAKAKLGLEPSAFHIPEDVAFAFGVMKERGELSVVQWQKQYENLPQITKERLDKMIAKDVSHIVYPQFEVGESMATRVSNGKILNAISQAMEGFIGGSADLAPSNNTHLENEGDFPQGKNWHFGIREHAMGAITNGVANYGLFLPFCATFFVFSDYMSPSVRVASLMKARVYYIWTHDSIGVGEDGATHQPIEQLSHFRAMPNLLVFRPADANENVACWQVGLDSKMPCAFVLSRQNLPVLESYTPQLKEQVQKGGYVILSQDNPHITLMASGSEVSLALKAAQSLEQVGIKTQVVSVPCFDLLLEQDKSYKASLCKGKVLAIEASRGLEWHIFADDVIGMSGFGASGKGDALFEHFGFSVAHIVEVAQELVKADS